MKQKVILKLSALVIVFATILSLGTGLGISAESTCFHDPAKGIIGTADGYTIANICTLCGKTLNEIGYVNDDSTITLYKDKERTDAYTEAELTAGFANANGTTLYTPAGTLVNTGKPYWLAFDLKVNALPTLENGNTQADLNNTNSRAYKGCSIICTYSGGSYLSPLRLIYDGWEAESEANGTTGATPDGKAPIKLSASDNEYRNTQTVVEVKA